MKIQFRLLGCLMAIAMLAACSNDETSPMGDAQHPVAGEAVKVKAYVPDNAPGSRVELTENGDQTISLEWETEESFSVIRGSSNETFSKTEEGNEFSGALPTDGTGPYYAFYPATAATNATAVPFDLSTQTGLLNSASTYMHATSTDGVNYQFGHLTAILKATFSGLPADATVSRVVVTTVDSTVDGTVNLTDGTIAEGEKKDITIDYATAVADAAHYIYLPPMAAEKKALSFQVHTVDGYIYSGDLSGGTKAIEAGKLYTATVGLTKVIPYLTFSATDVKKLKMNVYGGYTLPTSLEYSVGGGAWTKLTANTEIEFGGNNGNLRLRGMNEKGTAESYSEYSFISFSNTTTVACTGDIRTLVDWENHAEADTDEARFCYLFKDCTSLTSAPALPATELAEYCYSYMFYGCTNLTSAPALPATTLVEGCYSGMFFNCSSLTVAPALPAMNLAESCYQQMFFGCSSLTAAPALPATTLAEWCYDTMFFDCTSLTTAPVLPATTLVTACYRFMFVGCTSLNSITMLATDISASSSMTNWVLNVASTGTFTKAAGATIPTSIDGIPSDWTVVEQ